MMDGHPDILDYAGEMPPRRARVERHRRRFEDAAVPREAPWRRLPPLAHSPCGSSAATAAEEG